MPTNVLLNVLQTQLIFLKKVVIKIQFLQQKSFKVPTAHEQHHNKTESQTTAAGSPGLTNCRELEKPVIQVEVSAAAAMHTGVRWPWSSNRSTQKKKQTLTMTTEKAKQLKNKNKKNISVNKSNFQN